MNEYEDSSIHDSGDDPILIIQTDETNTTKQQVQYNYRSKI